MGNTRISFGGELRRRRIEQGISQTELAHRVACSKSQLCKVEKNQKTATPQLAADCDRVLGAHGELAALLAVEAAEAPMGLPPAPAHFVGRSEELSRIAEYLADTSGSTVFVLSGLAGAGKTALALRAAWDASGAFADGCFYFDFDETPARRTQDVIESLLRLMGMSADELPSRQDALANLWRRKVQGKRMVLVLDNVRTASEIAPLLSGESGCKIVATSRTRLKALDEAAHLPIGMLAGADAVALLRAVGGTRAEQAAERTVRAIAEHCGRLPLALRIVAACIRSTPTQTAADIEQRLSRELHRLPMLDDGERNVTAALTVSCHQATGEQRRLLALLALHPGPWVDLRAVAALAGIDPHHAALLTDGLANAHLVDYESSDRITLHDLVRQYARYVVLPEVAPDEQQRALQRLLEHCLRLAVAADKLLTPHRYRPPAVLDDFPMGPPPFRDRTAGLRWIEAEWRSLAALCRAAADHGLHSMCWQLAFALREFFFLAKRWGPWIETHRLAVESAETAGARFWLAISLGNLGVAHADRGDLTVAIGYYQKSLDLYRQLGDQHGVFNTISNLAWAEMYLGDRGNALAGLRTVLGHYRKVGNRRNAAIALRGIALLESELGFCAAAVEHALEARRTFQDLALDLDVVMSMNCAAWAHFRSGNHVAAGVGYQEALALAESCGSRYEQARALTGLGNIRRVSGDRETAAELWTRADAVHGGLEPVMLGEARVRLAG